MFSVRKPPRPPTPPTSQERDRRARTYTYVLDGTLVTLTQPALKQLVLHRRDAESASRRERRRMAEIMHSNRVQARLNKAIQRQLDKVERHAPPRKFRVRAAPSDSKTIKRKQPSIAPKRSHSLPRYEGPIIDHQGRQGIVVTIEYDGAKRHAFGIMGRRIIYLSDLKHCEIDDEGNPFLFTNLGADIAEMVAGADVNELAQRESRADAKLNVNIVIQLPHDVPPTVRATILRAIAHELFGRHGLPYAASLHKPDPDGDQRNFHGHICGSWRPMKRTGSYCWDVAQDFRSDLDGKDYWRHARRRVAEIMTGVLQREGDQRHFTHLSNAERGLIHKPQKKLDKRKTRAAREGEFVADVSAMEALIAANTALAKKLEAAREERRKRALHRRLALLARLKTSVWGPDPGPVTKVAVRAFDANMVAKVGPIMEAATLHIRRVVTSASGVQGGQRVEPVGDLVRGERWSIGRQQPADENLTEPVTQIRPVSSNKADIAFRPVLADTPTLQSGTQRITTVEPQQALVLPHLVKIQPVTELVVAAQMPSSVTQLIDPVRILRPVGIEHGDTVAPRPLKPVATQADRLRTLSSTSTETGAASRPVALRRQMVPVALTLGSVAPHWPDTSAISRVTIEWSGPSIALRQVSTASPSFGKFSSASQPLRLSTTGSITVKKGVAPIAVPPPVGATIGSVAIHDLYQSQMKLMDEFSKRLATLAAAHSARRLQADADRSYQGDSRRTKAGENQPMAPIADADLLAEVEDARSFIARVRNKAIHVGAIEGGLIVPHRVYWAGNSLTLRGLSDPSVQASLVAMEERQAAYLRHIHPILRETVTARLLFRGSDAVIAALPAKEQDEARRWARTGVWQKLMRWVIEDGERKSRRALRRWRKAKQNADATRFARAAEADAQICKWRVDVSPEDRKALEHDMRRQRSITASRQAMLHQDRGM